MILVAGKFEYALCGRFFFWFIGNCSFKYIASFGKLEPEIMLVLLRANVIVDKIDVILKFNQHFAGKLMLFYQRSKKAFNGLDGSPNGLVPIIS